MMRYKHVIAANVSALAISVVDVKEILQYSVLILSLLLSIIQIFKSRQ